LVLSCTNGLTRVDSYWGATTERFYRSAVYDWWPQAEKQAPQKGVEKLHWLIYDNIEAVLEEMGYRKRAGEIKPDFLIAFHIGSGLQPSSSGPQNVAMLTIEAYAPDGHLVWRGWAEGSVDTSLPPEARKSRIESAVRATLHQFEPAKG